MHSEMSDFNQYRRCYAFTPAIRRPPGKRYRFVFGSTLSSSASAILAIVL